MIIFTDFSICFGLLADGRPLPIGRVVKHAGAFGVDRRDLVELLHEGFVVRVDPHQPDDLAQMKQE